MSQSVSAVAPQETSGTLPARAAVSRGLIVIVFVLALAHLPLLVLHGQTLWAREHYQFFPVLLPAALALAYRNVRGLGPLTPGRRSVSSALFGLALLFLTLGIVMISPWLGAVAAQVTLLAAAFSLGGRRLVARLLPAWLLLCLAIPLPGRLDRGLIDTLQALTSIGASQVLEVAGVLHVRRGNVLDLGGHSILVEEACSGVHSLFAVLACTLFWSARLRRHPLHALLLLLAALPIVLGGNVARIVAVATLDGVGGVNLASGWGHEALGLCLFVAMLGLIWSTDQLLLLLTPLIQMLIWSIDQLVLLLTPWIQIPWRSFPAQNPDNLNVSPLPTQPSPAAAGPGPTRLPRLAATALSAWPIVASYGLLAVAAAGALGAQIRGFSIDLPADTIQALETLKENILPQQVGTWKRASFEVNEKHTRHPMARYSRTWRYQSGDQSAVAAIFYPYAGWKELPDCYAGEGWTVENRVVHNADPVSETGPYVTVHLYQPEKESYGYLMFQARNSSGRPLTPPAEGFREFVSNRLAVDKSWQTLTSAAWAPHASPTYLVQLFVESSSALESTQEQQAQGLYQQTLRALPK